MPVMSLEGVLLSESDFCTNTIPQLRRYPCLFPNIFKARDPVGVVEKKGGGLGSEETMGKGDRGSSF